MKYCTHCGYRLEDSVVFCPKCGKQSDITGFSSQNVVEDRFQRTQERKKINFARWGALIGAGVVISIAIVVVITSRKSIKSEIPSEVEKESKVVYEGKDFTSGISGKTGNTHTGTSKTNNSSINQENESYWLLTFGQTLGWMYHACFYPDGTIIAFPYSGGDPIKGTFLLNDEKLILSFDIFDNIMFVQDPEEDGGYRSVDQYEMMSGHDYYRISSEDESCFIENLNRYNGDGEKMTAKSNMAGLLNSELQDGKISVKVYGDNIRQTEYGTIVSADVICAESIPQDVINTLKVGDCVSLKTTNLIITDIKYQPEDYPGKEKKYFFAVDDNGMQVSIIYATSGEWELLGYNQLPVYYTERSGDLLIQKSALLTDERTGLGMGTNVYGIERAENYMEMDKNSDFFKLNNIEDYFRFHHYCEYEYVELTISQGIVTEGKIYYRP